jgi:hypothetical protein
MRTTLEIEDDVLAAARRLAEMRQQSMGKVVSDLARRSLQAEAGAGQERNGFPQFQPGRAGPIITLELVNQLRDEVD